MAEAALAAAAENYCEESKASFVRAERICIFTSTK